MSSITQPTQCNQEVASSNNRSSRVRSSFRAFGTLVVLLTFSSTGWSASPSDGDYIGLYWDSVDFSGYTNVSGATIYIQAKASSGRWVTFATTTASTSGYRGWYSWSTSAVIPGEYWEQTDPDYPICYAEVRAVRRSGWYTIQLGPAVEVGGWTGGSL